ncbi:helix-turn-helix domain-containing protein [Hujiaoplasma nucleasis]|uniref:Helix-turn-helix domain-containing protein n=1 Tax=Hujiaoplasma nucleasis TaxID=2725268 RepID=A0A7L6N1Q3_9MOLU|nr:helix-turn-helix domain-containing protein [Hujiaoplasma nucleasis]QLY40200.1 helix-turn-helix domain-containing protein [Hujiaoplasma nucleasis]
MRDETRDFYTVPEIAKVLKVSPQTVLKLLKKNELKGFRMSNQWRISKLSLDAFIDRNSNERILKK